LIGPGWLHSGLRQPAQPAGGGAFSARLPREIKGSPRQQRLTRPAERGETRAYVSAMFDAIHVKARNPGDLTVLENCLDEAGLDARAYLDGLQRADIKQGLLRSTEDAVARGVFGAPTFFVGEEMFWGQDRMDAVAEALGE